MPTVLFIVKAVVPKGKEEEFNRWYDEVHIPMVLQFNGVVSARRYKAIVGEEKYQYMAVYEVKDEATFKRLMDSDHMKALRADYDAKWGAGSERARFGYIQVFP